MNGIESKAWRQVQQDADQALKGLKLKLLGQTHDEVLLTTDRRYKHYKAIEVRIILKDGVLFQKYYGKIDSVKYYQVFIPKQLVHRYTETLIDILESPRQ